MQIEQETIEVSPESLAEEFFSKSIDQLTANSLQAYQLTGLSSVSETFEFLLVFLLEGIKIKFGLDQDLSCFDENTLSALDPWFKLLGFSLKVREMDSNQIDYYCKINKEYIILLNPRNILRADLQDYYALFGPHKQYAIRFEYCFSNTSCHSL